MTVKWEYPEQIKLWKWIPKEPTDHDDVFCSECKQWSEFRYWRLGEIPCESCDTHLVIICPICDEYYDHVYAEPFEVK